MIIRNYDENDLEVVNSIYAYARQFMKKTGNPNQWGDTSPVPSLLEGDIRNRTGYVIVDDDNEIVGVFAFIIGDDETYQYIEDGNWPNDERYGTIHRIASSGKIPHIFEIALGFCETIINNIRIDTHFDNKVMQHKIESNGFERCGIIYVSDGTPRIAYQKVV